jgi:hypothetical protein
MVVIPILALNRDVAIWGPDAMEFVCVFSRSLQSISTFIYQHNSRPERWEAPPPGASAIPGVWGNMLTFLGGPRSCIGFRFSLVESVLFKRFLCSGPD